MSQKLSMFIGKLVREARRAIGLTQVDAAALCGLNRKALIALEDGRGRVTSFTAVCEKLDLHIAGIGSGRTTGEQIRLKRERLGQTQAAFAKRVGLSVPTLREVENDRGNIASLDAVLAVIARQPKARAPARPHWEHSSRAGYAASDRRLTPSWLITSIVEALGPIDIDPCGHPADVVGARRRLTVEDDGLATPWFGDLAWVNPPYSALSQWIVRIDRAWRDREVSRIAALLPLRTDTAAFHELVLRRTDVLILRRRVRFLDQAGKLGNQVPFPLCIAVWGAEASQIATLAEKVECTWLNLAHHPNPELLPRQVSHSSSAQIY